LGVNSLSKRKRIALPEPVSRIYAAVAELEAKYKDRKFTPDGHLLGSLGEVVAREVKGVSLYGMSHRGHDAHDAKGDIEVKLTARNSVSLRSCCKHLFVLHVLPPDAKGRVYAEVIYDGPGAPAWAAAGKPHNGQRAVSLAKLRRLADAQT
jgi:hypothetical protein